MAVYGTAQGEDIVSWFPAHSNKETKKKRGPHKITNDLSVPPASKCAAEQLSVPPGVAELKGGHCSGTDGT